MRKLLFLSILLSCSLSFAKPYKVAILDTGFTPLFPDNAIFKLCDSGHYDFNEEAPEIGFDDYGHGSFVTYLINANADTNNMCYVIYKVFGPNTVNGHDVIDRALVMAAKSRVNAINMSLYMTNHSYKTKKIIKKLTRRGIKIFVSAGNEGRNLNQKCFTYPVCYKGINRNMVVVGALDNYGEVARYSNIGLKVDVYKMGDIGRSRGTSFAAPRALGKYIKKLKLDKK
jgi:subtilisin family serine protease